MKKAIVLLLVLLLIFPVIAMADEVVNVFNWEDYIAPDVLDDFTKETGIQVNYMRFTTNEDMMVQVEANPSAFDLVFPSEYMVERMLKKDLLAEINFDHIPNFSQLLDNLKNPSYDPENKHSVPYMWGTVGILYNKNMVQEPVTSWNILWDTKYQNNVFMLDSIRDSMGITLKALGYSMNTRDPAALEAAKARLVEQKTSGVVKAYQVDETKDKMVANEAALALMWSGDAQYSIDLNPDLAYAIPEEGSNVWVDAMVIPKAAKNPENAEKLINFLCRPDIAKRNCEKIWYSSPNKGAIELMGEAYTGNTTMNPDSAALEKCEYFSDIDDFIAIYNALWLEVKGAN